MYLVGRMGQECHSISYKLMCGAGTSTLLQEIEVLRFCPVLVTMSEHGRKWQD